jgi:hypothetical protein
VTTLYVWTTQISAFLSLSKVQIDVPSRDHTNETLPSTHLISLFTAPVLVSQIRMVEDKWEVREWPSGE